MTSHYHSSSSGVTNFYTFVKVRNPEDQPFDSVQEICMDPFNTSEHGFVTGGWDGVLRYGRIKGSSTEELQLPFQIFLEHPIVAVTIGRNNIAFAGLSTGDIVAVDMPNKQSQIIGGHQGVPICKLFWLENYGILMSFGFDQKMKFWNLSDSNGNFLAQEYNLPFKTFTVAYDSPWVMVGTGEGKLGFIDLRNLPNLKIPHQDNWTNSIEFGSKLTCSAIKVNSKILAVGAADGRVAIHYFKEGYNGIQIIADHPKKMYSKSQKRQSSYNHTPLYAQVNDIDIGVHKNIDYLVISGTEEISFFNLERRDKLKRIKVRSTCGKITLDGNYFVFAEGNDWLEGMSEWKKVPSRPKIEAVKYSRSELEDLIAPKK